MNKYILTLFITFSYCNFTFSQCPKNLVAAIQDFHNALVEKNTAILRDATTNNLQYIHSNLWVENQSELIINNETKYLTYSLIHIDSVQCFTSGKTGIVRLNGLFSGIVNDKEFKLKLSVLQCWIKKKNKWKLIARQGVKIP